MIKIFDLKKIGLEDIVLGNRAADVEESVEATARQIIKNVRENGDRALIEYAKKFDGATLRSLEVSEDEIRHAYKNCDKYFIETLKMARDNIEAFHKKQLRKNFEIKKDGTVVGQRYIPLNRVGLYVPGGTAAYISTVLMDAVPAAVAGVKQVVMVSPTDSDGHIPDGILAAASIAGVKKIFKTGGAQAIAALAYGTETIPKVDKIVGPGNAYVAAAKRQVFGVVDIDMIAGPSDILIIADKTCDARFVAADMLSQAEHDSLASAVLATDSEELSAAVSVEIEKQLKGLKREKTARAAIEGNGAIILTKNLEQSVEVSNFIAPEHLEICVDNPFAVLGGVVNAGSVFLGKYTPEPIGDYFAGPNHTLPTNGTARFSSPLSVDDFVKKSSYICYTKEALLEVKNRVCDFAKREGLEAHAKSISVRFE